MANIFKKILCKLNPNKFYSSLGVKIGKKVKFYSYDPYMFSTEPWLVTLGDNVYVGINVQFLTHDMGTLLFPEKNFVICGNICVGNNVVIGMESLIMPGVKIGNNVIIGARSVVTKDVPDGAIVAGNPARIIGDIERYSTKIDDIMSGKNQRYWKNLEDMHNSKRTK